jgi:hypothetical protein
MDRGAGRRIGSRTDSWFLKLKYFGKTSKVDIDLRDRGCFVECKATFGKRPDISIVGKGRVEEF